MEYFLCKAAGEVDILKFCISTDVRTRIVCHLILYFEFVPAMLHTLPLSLTHTHTQNILSHFISFVFPVWEFWVHESRIWATAAEAAALKPSVQIKMKNKTELRRQRRMNFKWLNIMWHCQETFQWMLTWWVRYSVTWADVNLHHLQLKSSMNRQSRRMQFQIPMELSGRSRLATGSV